MAKRFVPVTSVGEVPVGQVRVFNVQGTSIALCNVAGTIHAIENVCSHDDGPLGEGALHGSQIECPRHGARFEVTTGAVCRMPAAFPVKTFPIRVENDRVMVEIEATP